ncbi:MAG TPA: phosphoribosyl-ATP diphosphatase [Stellaceae bacterium]|nr:phosphoribosyl-ATP diphosphatase [Stellaceae bacterium]
MSPLDRLRARIVASRDGDPAKSYTASLFQRGRKRIAQKLGEEAVEAVIATAEGDRAALIGESADLLYHLLVAWEAAGVAPDDVWAELERREGMSGIEEKASRGKS